MSAPAPNTTIDPISALVSAWEGELRSKDHTGNAAARDRVWASGFRSCTRAMALDLLHPEDRGKIEADALERMRRGNEREASIVARLMQIGPRCTPPFEVIEQQTRFEISDRDGTVLISGKFDGRLKFGPKMKPPFEVKSGETFKRATCLEDLDHSPWTRHALDQLLAYLLSQGEPWGFFIIDRPGVPLFLRVNLEDHLARAEHALQKARTAVDARFGRVAMPPFTQDRAECRRCDHFKKSCAPPSDYGAGVQVITDPHLITLAEIREANRAAGKEYERADKEIKAALRGVESALLGDFIARGTWQKGTKTNVPDDIKAQYSTVDPKAKFILKIDRLEDATA
jgi:hypothetical protein